jgi:hypothetical protein
MIYNGLYNKFCILDALRFKYLNCDLSGSRSLIIHNQFKISNLQEIHRVWSVFCL